MTIPARCPICSLPTEVELPDGSPITGVTLYPMRFPDGVLKAWCSSCIKADDRKKSERKHVANELDWHAVCPPEYRLTTEMGQTDAERLRRFQFRCTEAEGIRALINLAVDSRRPLLIYGEPGAMKTRMAWRIARYAFDKGIPVFGYTAWTFQAASQDAMGTYRQERWMKRLQRGFVLLDDITKSPWTANTKAAFFALLEQVTSKKGLMVITSNQSKSDIANFAGDSSTCPDASAPVLRRLEEHFVRVLAVKQS